MPLKLKLAAHESLIVNGAVLVNGEFRTNLIIRNFTHVMREKDVLREADANTPTRRLYFIIQTMLMQPPPSTTLVRTYQELLEQLRMAYVRAENLEILQRVDELVVSVDYYKALAALHPLIAYEAGLLNIDPHQWRRSPPSYASAARLSDQSAAAPS
jgi:flagellar protein FlbT